MLQNCCTLAELLAGGPGVQLGSQVGMLLEEAGRQGKEGRWGRRLLVWWEGVWEGGYQILPRKLKLRGIEIIIALTVPKIKEYIIKTIPNLIG